MNFGIKSLNLMLLEEMYITLTVRLKIKKNNLKTNM